MLLAGCAPEPEKPPPEPMPTDGPNEAVLYIPAMVCESCTEEVTTGLASLPWVDQESIHADRKLRQVKFKVTDPASFDLAAARDAIARHGFRNVKLLTGPAADGREASEGGRPPAGPGQ
jgi:copper chaperone CopZ